MAMLEQAVGRGGRNLVHDVAAVQAAFSALFSVDRKPLWTGPVDGAWARHGSALEAAIEAFQRTRHQPPTGRIDPFGQGVHSLEQALPPTHRGLKGLAGTAVVYHIAWPPRADAPAPLTLPKAERAALDGLIDRWQTSPGLPMAPARIEVTGEGRFHAALVAQDVEWFEPAARRFEARAGIPEAVRLELMKAPTGDAHWRAVVRAGVHPSFDLLSQRTLAALHGPPALDLDAMQRFQIASSPDDAAARACIAGCARLLEGEAVSAPATGREIETLLEALDAGAPEAARAIRLAEGPDPGDVFDAEPFGGRPLTPGEISLARSVFGNVVDYGTVKVFDRPALLYQRRDTAVAPDGNIYAIRGGPAYSDDYSQGSLALRGLFIHEMTHVWQVQTHIWVALRGAFRPPRAYRIEPEKSFFDYNIEQQGDIVRDYYYLREGSVLPAKPPISVYRSLIPFVREK